MAGRNLFSRCCFTLSSEVTEGMPLIETITSLGFSVKSTGPVVVERDNATREDILKLMMEVERFFEPQVGDDFEIIDEDAYLGDLDVTRLEGSTKTQSSEMYYESFLNIKNPDEETNYSVDHLCSAQQCQDKLEDREEPMDTGDTDQDGKADDVIGLLNKVSFDQSKQTKQMSTGSSTNIQSGIYISFVNYKTKHDRLHEIISHLPVKQGLGQTKFASGSDSDHESLPQQVAGYESNPNTTNPKACENPQVTKNTDNAIDEHNESFRRQGARKKACENPQISRNMDNTNDEPAKSFRRQGARPKEFLPRETSLSNMTNDGKDYGATREYQNLRSKPSAEIPTQQSSNKHAGIIDDKLTRVDTELRPSQDVKRSEARNLDLLEINQKQSRMYYDAEKQTLMDNENISPIGKGDNKKGLGFDKTGRSSENLKEDKVDNDGFMSSVFLRLQHDPKQLITILAHICHMPKRNGHPNVEVDLGDIDNTSVICLKGQKNEVREIYASVENFLVEQDVKFMKSNTLAGVKWNTGPSYSSPTLRKPFSFECRSRRESTNYKTNNQSSFRLNSDYVSKPRNESLERQGSSGNSLQKNEFITRHVNIKVRVVKADITKLRVDAIVNAANSKLRHGGGVARAISDAAGYELSNECNNFTKHDRSVKETDMFVSTGGKLPAKLVFHAVGPKWDKYGEGQKNLCAEALRRTVLRCLVEADKRGLKSIALPSISAAIFKVPMSICTGAYLQAVQAYDVFHAHRNAQNLTEIMFVDVVDQTVNTIYTHFFEFWNRYPSSEQLDGDCLFATEHLTRSSTRHDDIGQAITSRGKETRNENRDIGQALPSKVQKPRNENRYIGQAITSREKETRNENRDARIQATTSLLDVAHFSGDSREGTSQRSFASYALGKITLIVASSEQAFSNHPDLVCILGPGPGMSFLPKLPLFADLLYCSKKHFQLGGVYHVTLYHGPKIPMTADIDIGLVPSKKKIGEVFQYIKKYLPAIFEFSTKEVKKVIFTSHHLFTSESIRGEPDTKLVGELTRNVYEMVTGSDPLPVTVREVGIAAGQEELATVTKVLDSRTQVYPSPGNSNAQKECPICCDSLASVMLKCCGFSMCERCERKVQRCPQCSKPFGLLTGDQPDGSMDVRRSSIYLAGYEKDGCYIISYLFPRGIQGPKHPDPGKSYEGVTRTAYIPATSDGLHVVTLLRLAFLRRLVFTIGDSVSTGRKGVITWNDIHHKTNLKRGHVYGYPDQNYLYRVKEELRNKGVTCDSMRASERSKLGQVTSVLRVPE